MGYTHYWSFKKAERGQIVKTEKNYQRAVLECTKVIQYYSRVFRGLSGFSPHAPIDLYRGLEVNSSQRIGVGEPFTLRERYALNKIPDFCKTNRLPYDTVVTACLIILKHRLGEMIEVKSDGRQDDWNDGLILARKILKIKTLKIPESILPNIKAPQNEAS